MTLVSVRQGSLTEGEESVLVNASNTQLALGSGVSQAIRLACGGAAYQARLTEEVDRKLGGALRPGEVHITDAGSHPRARYVAHAAVMDYRKGSPEGRAPDDKRIRRLCEKLWPALETLGGEQSVAMVALGAGTGGMGLRDTTEIACTSLRTHLDGTANTVLQHVLFYGFELHEFVVTTEVVSAFFDVPRSDVPQEVWSLVESREDG